MVFRFFNFPFCGFSLLVSFYSKIEIWNEHWRVFRVSAYHFGSSLCSGTGIKKRNDKPFSFCKYAKTLLPFIIFKAYFTPVPHLGIKPIKTNNNRTAEQTNGLKTLNWPAALFGKTAGAKFLEHKSILPTHWNVWNRLRISWVSVEKTFTVKWTNVLVNLMERRGFLISYKKNEEEIPKY